MYISLTQLFSVCAFGALTVTATSPPPPTPYDAAKDLPTDIPASALPNVPIGTTIGILYRGVMTRCRSEQGSPENPLLVLARYQRADLRTWYFISQRVTVPTVYYKDPSLRTVPDVWKVETVMLVSGTKDFTAVGFIAESDYEKYLEIVKGVPGPESTPESMAVERQAVYAQQWYESVISALKGIIDPLPLRQG